MVLGSIVSPGEKPVAGRADRQDRPVRQRWASAVAPIGLHRQHAQRVARQGAAASPKTCCRKSTTAEARSARLKVGSRLIDARAALDAARHDEPAAAARKRRAAFPPAEPAQSAVASKAKQPVDMQVSQAVDRAARRRPAAAGDLPSRCSRVRSGLPALLWAHGGGYALGVPEQDIATYRQLIAAGDCVIVARGLSAGHRTRRIRPRWTTATTRCCGSSSNAAELGVRDDQLGGRRHERRRRTDRGS
jgi:hypothetical protein